MEGWTEPRVTASGRVKLEWVKYADSLSERGVGIKARENRYKERGVDISIFLNEEDVLEAVDKFASVRDAFRMKVISRMFELEAKTRGGEGEGAQTS